MPYSDSTSPRSRFTQHKNNAAKRGIPFLLTFEEWWDAWKEAWPYRGRGPGRYVMARIGDQGAYERGNVWITTQEENSSTKCGVRPHTVAKLAEADIPRVRDMLICGVIPAHIGKWFGVSRSAIRQIADGITWRGH